MLTDDFCHIQRLWFPYTHRLVNHPHVHHLCWINNTERSLEVLSCANISNFSTNSSSGFPVEGLAGAGDTKQHLSLICLCSSCLKADCTKWHKQHNSKLLILEMRIQTQILGLIWETRTSRCTFSLILSVIYQIEEISETLSNGWEKVDLTVLYSCLCWINHFTSLCQIFHICKASLP